MNVGDKVAFRIRRTNNLPSERRNAFLRARGIITRTANCHWIDVEWDNNTIGRIGWHPSSLILTDRIHMEDLDECR
jgi:hypothetical protein